jgi:hypothetical protein
MSQSTMKLPLSVQLRVSVVRMRLAGLFNG